MLLAAMLIDALHAALENAVIAFDRVRADDLLAFAANVFVFRMVHRVVTGEPAAISGYQAA